jgi:sporulation protein YlmC with PRC-barrel domain
LNACGSPPHRADRADHAALSRAGSRCAVCRRIGADTKAAGRSIFGAGGWSRVAAAAIVGAGLVGATAPGPAWSDTVELVVVDVTAVAKGYRASKLMGSSVVNDQNERIGTIDDLVVDQERVLFAILQVGGFLGLGGRLVAVPYEALVMDPPGGKVQLPGATKDQLKKLPEFKYS